MFDTEELKSAIASEMENSVSNELVAKKRMALEYYNGNLPAKLDTAGRSGVVSTDVADSIEWLLPNIVESLTGKAVRFSPMSQADEEQAQLEEEITAFAFNEDNNGFLAMYESVKDALIDPEWFDAALEAEERFKYRPSGAVVLGFDPADTGPDAAGLAVRHGAKVLDLALKHDGNVSEALDWSLDYLDRYHCSDYVYDGDGLGLGLAREVERALAPRDIRFTGFRGGATPENPSALHSSFKTQKDAFFNRRAQAYFSVRERFWKTFQAMEGEFMDPDELIFLPKDHQMIDQLRAEICRIPLVPNQNGKLQIMPKTQMAKPPLNLPSPNLADALVYAFTVSDYISGSWGKPIEYKEAYI